MRGIITAFVFLLSTAAWAQWTPIADCLAHDGYSGAANVYHDGTKIIIQVMRIDESLDEYATNEGAITQLPVDIDKFVTDLSCGTERSIVATTAASTEDESQITPAALMTLKLPEVGVTASEINGSISRRGKLMLLICNRPAVPN